MPGYDQIFLPLCGGLTLLGLIASWFAWRRRGVASGLRGVAWSLIPLAVYLLGVARLLWRFGTAIASFAGSFVLSPLVWSGVIVAGLSVILFAISGRLRSRRARSAAAGKPAAAANGRPAAEGRPGTAALPAQPKAKGKPAHDDDMGDIEEILRRRGIR